MKIVDHYHESGYNHMVLCSDKHTSSLMRFRWTVALVIQDRQMRIEYWHPEQFQWIDWRQHKFGHSFLAITSAINELETRYANRVFPAKIMTVVKEVATVTTYPLRRHGAVNVRLS